ncbi:hypothetical protein GCM10010910_17440 [Microbacterium nanhaiense]|uniref:Glycosyl hydrolase family 32 N-terminal domain-containing protein n=1 Tax=Microbacterium nanhaiense TaxID=1301026 RepID=A0ABQ2N0G5_9MICO|nr:hypothetical protein [Microbacterium nanhaiense]GGO63871.1 hypothetical protein GCM10010910_17440 [Microbacterium nanhaiense]
MNFDPERIRTPHKHPELVIAPSFREGDFFSHGVDCPFVFHHEGRLGMTMIGWDGIGYQTGLSWFDGEAWSSPELVFGRDAGSEHRRYNAALTSILRDDELSGSGELLPIDGWFYGTYHAYPAPGYEAGPGIVGIARSRNLRSWEEYGTPLIAGEGAAWERGGLYKSWLMRDGERFLLFYNAKDDRPRGWQEQTGAAESADLLAWRRIPESPLLRNGAEGAIDDRFASDPCVLRDGDTWVMFYFGLSSDGRARETYATSDDLVTWRRSEEVLIDVGGPGSIDSAYAHKPAVITHDGRLEHYYCAVAALPDPVEIGEFRQRERRGIAVARA